MDTLCSELSCPICLEIFTPPILELPCCHNYCKKCVQQTIDAQNHKNRQFLCPLCRRVTHLRSKGINGLKRNLFAENVLDKLRQEIERMAKKELVKKDVCPKHKEEENLYCLTDNQPVCTTCKIFGDHSTHEMARIDDVYKLRKESFAEHMKSVLSKCDAHASIIQVWLSNVDPEQREFHTMFSSKIHFILVLMVRPNDMADYSDIDLSQQELGHNMELLLFSKKHTQDFIKRVGDSLILEIQMKVSALIMRIEAEADMKSKRMQQGLEVLNEPKRLYDEMLQHADQSKTPLEFLKKEAGLKARAEKLVLLNELCPEYRNNVSHGKYVEELMTGFDVKKMGKMTKKSLARTVSRMLEEWKSDREHFDDTAYQSLDLMLANMVSLQEGSDESIKWEIESSDEDGDPKDVHGTSSKSDVLK